MAGFSRVPPCTLYLALDLPTISQGAATSFAASTGLYSLCQFSPPTSKAQSWRAFLVCHRAHFILPYKTWSLSCGSLTPRWLLKNGSPFRKSRFARRRLRVVADSAPAATGLTPPVTQGDKSPAYRRHKFSFLRKCYHCNRSAARCLDRRSLVRILDRNKCLPAVLPWLHLTWRPRL